MAFRLTPDEREKQREERTKAEQEREEQEEDIETRERRSYDPYTAPVTFTDWICVKGKADILHFLQNPTKRNLVAIYNDLKPKTRVRASPSFSLKHPLIPKLKFHSTTREKYGLFGGFYKTMRKEVSRMKDPPLEKDAVIHLWKFIQPLWSSYSRMYRFVDGVPDGMPNTYSAFEVWFRNQLGLPIPHRLRDVYSQLQSLLAPPEFPFP